MSIGGATYDLFVRVPHDIVATCKTAKAFALPLGEKLRIQNVTAVCGGGACNTAVGLARLGCRAAFEGVIGSDQWGEKLMENFTREGVETGCITVVEGEVSSFSIILSADGGERVILYTPGANEHLHDANFDRDIALAMDWIYLNHIPEQTWAIQDDIVPILTGKRKARLTWNPGGHQIDRGVNAPDVRALLAQTSLLLLNREEAERFTRTDGVGSALGTLCDLCPGIVCITDGSRGTAASDGKKLCRCPAVAGTAVVETTGAGDAFGTGVTWALIEELPLPEALKAGTINASSVIGAIGAQAGLLTDTEIRKRLQASEIEVEVTSLR